MPTLYFVYSTLNGIDAPEPPNSPYSITWHVGRFLREKARAIGYEFRFVNLDDTTPATIQAQDIVIGHTWFPDGWMNRALDSDAKVKIVMQPYSENMVAESERGWVKNLFAKADRLLFITGRYWFDRMADGPFAEWVNKATRLDMAINPALHPHSKRTWGKQGKRRVLAIGSDIPAKGLDLIADLARNGGWHLGYYGSAPFARFAHVPQIAHYGGVDFTPDIQAIVTSEYDFFISLARSDANPTTLLETTCWGLLGLCNERSGYYPEQPFVELKNDDLRWNLEQIDRLQVMPEYLLRQRAEWTRQQVMEQHTWERFCATVWADVEKRL